MNDNNRVLTRKNARMLSEKKVDRVSKSLPTDTACTWDPRGNIADGDVRIGEC